MARLARRGLLPLAAFAVMALFALCLAAVVASAGVNTATQSKLRTRTYKGTSSNDPGATMLVKARVNRRGIPRQVVLVRVTGGKMECWLDPATGFSTVEPVPTWTYGENPVPVTIENNGRYRNIRGFWAVKTSGGETPHHLGQEEFTVSGRFALNGKSANVNFGRAFEIEGSAVESSEESVYCDYHGLFQITPVVP